MKNYTTLLDRNGVKIKKDDDVIFFKDNNEVQGVVYSFKRGELVTLYDQDGDYFDIEPNDIEVINQ